MNGLDRFDLEILRIIQKDNLTPQRKIGEMVNLSAAAVQRRIKRMHENGVIKADVSIIDPSLIGCPITIVVEVEMQHDRKELTIQAKHKFSSCKQVQQCYYVTGDVDFVLIINVATMVEYEALTQELFFDNENVKRYKTFVALDRVKVNLELPLPEWVNIR